VTRKRLAVLGQPVSHSRSPAMHNAALAELGLADEWSYEAIEVAPADFEAPIRRLAAEGFVGANVTVPHKVAALELADQASEAARAIGATVVDGLEVLVHQGAASLRVWTGQDPPIETMRRAARAG
jgi:shikimate 5-dehydrogenase